MRRDMRFGKRLWAQGWEGRIDDSTEGRIRRNTKAPGGQAQPRTRLNLRRSLAFGDDDFVAVAQRNVRSVLEAYRNEVITPFFL